MFFHTLQCIPLRAARPLQPAGHRDMFIAGCLTLKIRNVGLKSSFIHIITMSPTLNTMCNSILSPAFPGYLVAMLAGERSNMLAPVSVQIACTSIFLPTPLGPAIISDLTWGAFSCTTWEPTMSEWVSVWCVCVYVCVCVCMCACVYVCIYVYVQEHTTLPLSSCC